MMSDALQIYLSLYMTHDYVAIIRFQKLNMFIFILSSANID